MGAWPALLLSLALPQLAVAVELVGKTMPPYPDGLREVGGACLSDSTDAGHVCDYSIGLLADANADPDAEPLMRYVIAGRMADMGYRLLAMGSEHSLIGMGAKALLADIRKSVGA